MPTAKNKAYRLQQIEALLLDHPQGLTPAALARRLGVHRSTIGRCLPDMSGCVYVDDVDGGRWKIDRRSYLVNVRFSLHEAAAVHLAARLLATCMDRQNPHAASALRKLGLALQRVAPHLSRCMAGSADAIDNLSRWSDPGCLQTLETLTLAWAESRRVRVWRRDEQTGEVKEYLFEPWYIEPSAAGRSTYAFGLRIPPGELRTFKIERIERAELTRETYTLPPDFDPAQRLADAWGIWYTDQEPVEVVLKFKQRVAQRVRETRWHRSEQVTELEDGSLLWRARIAEPQEMMPWIRGWGQDVEVLEPAGAREKMVEEANALAALYLEKMDGIEP